MIKAIFVGEQDVATAVAGQSVTVTVDGEFDISRGDIIVDAAQPAEIADQFRAMVIWMQDTEMLPGRTYILRTEAARLYRQVGEAALPRECE